MRENFAFPILWDIVLVVRGGPYGEPGSVGKFLSLKLFALNENHNSSVIEFFVRNRYENLVIGKATIEMTEVFEIAGYAAALCARKDDFNVRAIIDTSDYTSETLITIRNGLGQQNHPLNFLISECVSGITGSDAPLTKEFLRCLYKLTNQEIPYYLT